MSSLFGGTTIEGNRLTDMPVQTCAVGIPIPFVYGAAPCDGNLIWAGELHEHVQKKKQGKGGVKTTEYTYTISYAVAFCIGPIFGYLTIKRDGKVVYTTDPNASVDDKDYAAKWLQKATLYYGTRSQNPDSTIEAQEGAGNVSAFRNIAYIAVEEDDVTDNGGAVPNYEAVCIANSVAYLTTPPYIIELNESLETSAGIASGTLRDLLWQGYGGDTVGVAGSVVSGDLRAIRRDEFMEPVELGVAGSVVSGELKVIRKDEFMEPVELGIAGSVNSGSLTVSRLDAKPGPDELAVAASVYIAGGYLGAP